jgi:hypothetical protein
MIRSEKISVTSTGANGNAAGTGQTGVISGRILAVHYDYVSQPATTDLTLATSHAPVITILTITSANTDALFNPRVLLDGVTGAALTAVYDAIVVDDHLTLTIAQGDNAGVINATIWYEC